MAPSSHDPKRPVSTSRYASRARATGASPRQKTVRVFATALLMVGGVAFAAGWNPPTPSEHKFTEVSDYDPATDSGCTNSGEGCHGAETEYMDFNVYHPDAECTACHEYDGVGCIPCHGPEQRECAACHDGTMENAADCVRLSDPYPNGHYRETSHTAMGTDMTRPVKAAVDGTAQLTCEDCHERDLLRAHTGVPVADSSEYGDSVGCGECHNDDRSHGLREVSGDWADRSCEACHDDDSSTPMHDLTVAGSTESSSAAGCGSSGLGCHQDRDLHAMHPNEPAGCSGNAAENEPGCHDLQIESHAPDAAGCGQGSAGGCHTKYPAADYGHEEDREVHSPATGRPARLTTYGGVPCGGCHRMDPSGTSLVEEHTVSTSARTEVAGDVCRNCHNHAASQAALEDEWDDRDNAGSCDACHGTNGLDEAHAGNVEAMHTAAGSAGCGSTGAGCHPSSDLSAVGEPQSGGLHASCLRCHDWTRSGGNMAYSPTASTCGDGRSCHSGGYSPVTSVHVSTDGTDAHHTAGTSQARMSFTDTASGVVSECADCHSMTLGYEHARPNASIARNTCLGCHNASESTAQVVKWSWETGFANRGCEACHGVQGMPARHAGIEKAHAAQQIDRNGKPTEMYCTRSGCHGSGDVRVIHAGIGCAMCHSADGDIVARKTMTCGGVDGQDACHTGADKHYDMDAKHQAAQLDRYGDAAEEYCNRPGCHASGDVRELHPEARCSTAGCHVEGGPTYMTCGGVDGQDACHTGADKHYDMDAKHQAQQLDRNSNEVEEYCNRPGCHASGDVRELHPEARCSTAGCHLEGGPTYMTCGGAEGLEGACHTGADKHYDMDAKHQAAQLDRYGDAAEEYCNRPGCHASGDVRELHPEARCSTAGCHVEGGPTYMTCGGVDGQDACHTGADKHYEKDAKHQAAQLDRYGDPVAEYCNRPGCHASGDVRSIHSATSCSTAGCHVEGGPTYMTCGGVDGQDACHTGADKHDDMDAKHQATELDPAGIATPGTCVSSGCHGTVDARSLHPTAHCSTSGCHVTGGPTYMSCGGASGGASCHYAYSSAQHFADHSADMSGTVGGVLYGLGENVGCFGCHAADLRIEHTVRLGDMEGGGASVCRVCHYDATDPGTNAYAGLSAITSAVATGDRRCVACHANAAGVDGGSAVAGPLAICTPTAPPPAIAGIAQTTDDAPDGRISLEGLRSVPLTESATAQAADGLRPVGDRTTLDLTPQPSDDATRSTESSETPGSDTPAEDEDGDDPSSESNEPAPAPADPPVPGDHGDDDPCPQMDETVLSTTTVPVPQSAHDTRICLNCHVAKE